MLEVMTVIEVRRVAAGPSIIQSDYFMDGRPLGLPNRFPAIHVRAAVNV